MCALLTYLLTYLLTAYQSTVAVFFVDIVTVRRTFSSRVGDHRRSVTSPAATTSGALVRWRGPEVADRKEMNAAAATTTDRRLGHQPTASGNIPAYC